ncbi:MAG: GDSL-type esterase/lipase family protein [Planctomycetota bacterium]
MKRQTSGWCRLRILACCLLVAGAELGALPLCKQVPLQGADSPDPLTFPAVPGLADDLQVRSGLARCQRKFSTQKTGLVAYLGGSITHNPGWTQLVDAELSRRFPDTKFTFVHAGIPSIDSTGHAFRLVRDVLEKGIPDLLFVEAAVNDLHNGRTPLEQRRGMEGVIRRARRANPDLDIVMLHFAEPRHTADYERQRIPEVIANHEAVARHYQITSLDLAHEVQRRLSAGQFDWTRDFKDLHPSPFGQRLYYAAVRRLFDQVWPESAESKSAESKSDASKSAAADKTADTGGRYQPLPLPLDPFCYDAGVQIAPQQTTDRRGFELVERWRPGDKAGTRAGFVDVPMLVGERPGDQLTLKFEGRAIGLWYTAGPDTGVVEYRVDDGPWKQRDTFTNWSRGLHLPWALLLESELTAGPHRLELRLAETKNSAATGTALRIHSFLVNGVAYQGPPLREVMIRSSLDQTQQPSLVFLPPEIPSAGAPVLIYLHSWSGDYRQDNSPWLRQAEERGWIFLHPNFRGINQQPQACGSRFARQDILDALAWLKSEQRVDEERVYLAGTSGGGHMAMLMAAYAPEQFTAVSAWVGISDLADWYRVHVKEGKRDHYAEMTVRSLGGAPGETAEVDEQYRERSPLFHLSRARDVPLDLAAGVTDGHTGSVPIFHSLRAFNVLAQAQGAAAVSDEEMQQLWTAGKLAKPQSSDEQADPTLGREIRLRRVAGKSRVTIFDGGHEGLPAAACAWLEKQRRMTR